MTFSGSSPLARGARTRNRLRAIPARLIPASAGSTLDDQRIFEPQRHSSFNLYEATPSPELPAPVLPPQLSGPTPACSASCFLTITFPHHELKPVKIGGFPVMPVCTKLHALFVIATVNQQRTAVLTQLHRSVP